MPAKPKLLQLLPCSPASTAASLAPRDEYSFSSNSLILPEICFPKTAQNWKGGEEKTACSTRLRILSGRGSVGLGDFFHPILFPCSDGRSRRKMLLYVHILFVEQLTTTLAGLSRVRDGRMFLGRKREIVEEDILGRNQNLSTDSSEENQELKSKLRGRREKQQ